MPHKLSPKENMLRLLRFNEPEYIPFGLEAVESFSHRDAMFFRGNGDSSLREWTDIWGVRFRLADEKFGDSAYPVSHPLLSLDDIEKFNFPDPNDPGIMENVKKGINSVDRSSRLVMLSNPAFMFVRSWLLHGMENLLAGMIAEPENVELLLEKIYLYQEVIIKRSMELKPDIIHFGDDAGITKALMMNPVIWRKMIKPRLKKIIDLCKNSGVIVLMHCCGRVDEIIDDIIEMGVDILNPIQAGANDLRMIKNKSKGKLTLYGGMDSHTIMTSDSGTVSALTEKILGILGEDGGYIASPDQGLPFPRENIEAMKKVVAEKGML